MDPYLSIQQAANYLGFSRSGIIYHLKLGRIGIPLTYGGMTLISSFELREFAKRRADKPFGRIGRPRKNREVEK